MKKCNTCMNREYKDDLVCCAANELHFAWTEFLRSLPLFGKYIEKYKCKAYEMDKSLTGWPKAEPVYCRCSFVPYFEEGGGSNEE